MTTSGRRPGSRWRSVVAAASSLLFLFAGNGEAVAACTEVSYVSGTRDEVRSRQVEVTYQEAVPREVVSVSYEYQLTGWSTAYRDEERTVLREASYPVWDYYIVHFNLWSGGYVTSCISWYQPANCGYHGWDWLDHWDEYIWYVAYYDTYSYWAVESVQVAYSEPIFELVPVTRTSTVTEWVTQTKTVTEYYTVYDIPVYSTYISCEGEPTVVVERVLTYDPAGGSGSVPAPRSYSAGTTVVLATVALSRPGYVYDGWFDVDGRPVTSVTLDSDTTVRAGWLPEVVTRWTLRYDANGGSGAVPAPSEHQDGDVVPLAGAGGLTRNGYRFSGWAPSPSASAIATVTMDRDRTVYAKWRKVAVRPS